MQEGKSVANDLGEGYDDSYRWLLHEGLMLCLFENFTGTEIAAVQTEAQLGMMFGEKNQQLVYVLRESFPFVSKITSVNILSTLPLNCSGPIHLTFKIK